MSAERVAALVPMKGHSERVPGKNVRSLAGAPLFSYVLSALAASPLIGEIVVDTDDDALATKVLEAFPAVRIIERPAELCGDFVPMNDILRHDAGLIESNWFLQTHSTNPLLTTETISRAVEQMLNQTEEYDSLMTVTPMQTRLWWGPNKPVNHDPNVLLRTQDLPVVYEENSNLFIFRREQILESGTRIGANPAFFEMDRIESWDIDEEEDFLIAEALVKWRRER